MPSKLEMIKLVASVVEPYDGCAGKVNSAINALKTIKPLVDNVNKAATVQAVIARYSEKAQSVLPEITEDTTLDDIIEALKKCQIKVNPSVALATLKATKQTGDPEQFIGLIDKNARALEQAYIEDGDPKETASKYANRAGIEALLDGLRCAETKLLVKAGRYTTLKEATETALEHLMQTANRNPADVSVLYMNRHQRYAYSNRRGMYNNNYRRNMGYRRNYNRNNTNNHRNNRYRNNFNRGNNRNQQYNNRQQQRVYVTNADQANTSQPAAVGPNEHETDNQHFLGQ